MFMVDVPLCGRRARRWPLRAGIGLVRFRFCLHALWRVLPLGERDRVKGERAELTGEEQRDSASYARSGEHGRLLRQRTHYPNAAVEGRMH
jgi:hypothetical protein